VVIIAELKENPEKMRNINDQGVTGKGGGMTRVKNMLTRFA